MTSLYSFERILPTSPDGTDWGIYGDTPKEQWLGVWFEAADYNALLGRVDDSWSARLPNKRG